MAGQDTMPERIGRYLLLEKIGEGGMGVVHLGRDAEGKAVAIKLLRPAVAGDPDARRRLAREFDTMRRVRSRFVAAVIDADLTAGVPYVVTRYVAGPSLDQMVTATGPLRGQALERLAWGLAEGLAAVHAAGVVHRDLKPGNVVMAGGVPVLIDFGIAHAPDFTKITQTGMFMGTPGYLAPEIVEGQPSGPPADVHSWGSTVAFAATGRPPFGTGSYETIFYRIVTGQADLAGVPARLLPMVTAALARDPARRPSALRLSAECAAVDLSRPDAPAVPILAGAAGPAGPAGTGTVVDGGPAFPAAPGQAARGRDNFADVLPPVRYAPAAPASRQAAPPNGDLAPSRQRPSPGGRANTAFRRLLSLVTMAIAVAVSVLLPVAGPAASLVVILLLRAADLAHRGLTRRRSAQGARATDVPVMIIKSPWAVLRALFGCLVLAPLALTCAVVAAAVTIMVTRADPLPAAGAYAAGAFVACYGFGPGSATPRRQLGRLFGVAARRRGPATLTAVVLTVLAVATVAAAVTQPHHLWPLTASLASHLRALHEIIRRLEFRLPRV